MDASFCLPVKIPTTISSFLILNISSVQLIPVNIIAYRSLYGSVNPVEIIIPALLATMVSTLVGVSYAKLKTRRRRN